MRSFLLALFLFTACIGADRATKVVATEHLQGQGRHTYLGDTIRIEYAENTGAFLGLGSKLSPEVRFWLLTVLTGAFLVGIGWVLVTHRGLSRWTRIGLVLVLAGGVGNLIDRMLYDGVVVDFLNLGVGSLRTGIFNVADVAITTGVVLLFALSFKKEEAEEEPTPATE